MNTTEDVHVLARRRALGEEIAEQRRVMKGWDRGELASALEISERAVTRWETGSTEMTFEQALAVEKVLGLPIGHLGGAGMYFGFQATPFSLEGEVVMQWYSDPEEMVEALEAAVTLGLGVRLRNQMEPDSGVDAVPDAYTEQWVLSLTGSTPLVDDDLHA
jgi:transcriptional regulator with XRE-family HTH domain